MGDTNYIKMLRGVSCWLVFVLSYVMTIATTLSYISRSWFALFILIHLPINWFLHMKMVEALRSNEEIAEIAACPCENKIILKIQQFACCCHVVFCKFKIGRKISKKVYSIAKKCHVLFIFLRIFTVVYTAVIIFMSDHWLQYTFSILLFIINVWICYMNFPKCFPFIIACCLACPLLICLIACCLIDKFCPCVLKLPRAPRRDLVAIYRSRVEAYLEVIEMRNQENGFSNQQRSVSFVPFKRMTTNKARSNMMKNWKKDFTPSENNKGENCCICLEVFEEAEEIIDLKCGIGHIFHPECIEAWSLKNHSCPLCRKDFIKIAKQEPEAIPDEHVNQVLNEEPVLNGALPVPDGALPVPDGTLPVPNGEENKSDGSVSA